MRHGGSLLRSAVRPAFTSQSDPLAFSTEDMIEEELDSDRPRKKIKFARKSGDWAFSQESASPELQPEDHDVTGTFDVDMIDKKLVAEEKMEKEAEGIHSGIATTHDNDRATAVSENTDMEMLDAPSGELADRVDSETGMSMETATATAPSELLTTDVLARQRSAGESAHSTIPPSTQSTTPRRLSSRTALFANGLALIAAEARQMQEENPDKAPKHQAELTTNVPARSASPQADTSSASTANALDTIASMGAEDPAPLDSARSVEIERSSEGIKITEEEDPNVALSSQPQPLHPGLSEPHDEARGSSIPAEVATALDTFALVFLSRLSEQNKRINRAGEIVDIADDTGMYTGNDEHPGFGYDGAASSKPFVQHQKFSQLADDLVPNRVDQETKEETHSNTGERDSSHIDASINETKMPVRDDSHTDVQRYDDADVQEDEADDVRSDDTNMEDDETDLSVSSVHKDFSAANEVTELEIEEGTNRAFDGTSEDGNSILEEEASEQSVAEDESALGHVDPRERIAPQTEDADKEPHSIKAILRRRGRTTRLMTFDEAMAATQPNENVEAEGEEEIQVTGDEATDTITASTTTIDSLPEDAGEQERLEASGKLEEKNADSMPRVESAKQAEEVADYLLDVLAKSSDAITPAVEDEQIRTGTSLVAMDETVLVQNTLRQQSAEGDDDGTEALPFDEQAELPKSKVSLRGVTMSPALATEHQLDVLEQRPRRESLPAESLSMVNARASKSIFKPYLPRQDSETSGQLSIINRVEDEYLMEQLIAQPKQQENLQQENPPAEGLRTPAPSMQLRSRAKSSSRKSVVPNELKGWFSPRDESQKEVAGQGVELLNTVKTNGHNAMLDQNDEKRVLSDKEQLQPEMNKSEVASDTIYVETDNVAESKKMRSATSKNKKQARKSMVEDSKALHEGLQTDLSYYTPLSNLHLHLNRVSSHSEPSTVDVLAVVSSSASEPSRATSGPRDYFTTFKITTPPVHSRVQIAFPQTQVQVFRPAKDVLPVAHVGDVVLLRDFVVRSAKGKCFLLSTASSSWCVWRFGKGSTVRVECLGPPVEIGKQEEQRAHALRKLWVLVDKEDNVDVVREEEVNGQMG